MKLKELVVPPTEHYADPSREENFDFLIRCYFGEGTNPLKLCIHRAYLDFNRTLHGFAVLNAQRGVDGSGVVS